ncbi:uncharacterized protein LOC110106920 [Dendrobium catenatum]|uniref:Uncharacterized protein n=1 Tax=Dendrobium catenatum TaxID=906689 RepID=A0A2I0X6L3_9ASPA|nr:uncharacterized protein LOC110106920 [Dendrobium catenatum]PKU83568.1 hypothetical protein MA16_Dca008255 [Dendrobium catenatum]
MVRKIVNPVAESTEADRSDSVLVMISAAAPIHQSQCQPVILSKTSKSTGRFAECAGRTTAECAAICCCFPCGLLNLLILAAVRLPAGLCYRCFRKNVILQRSKKKKAFLRSESRCDGSVKPRWSAEDAGDLVKFSGMKVLASVEDSQATRSPAEEVVEMEEKVWSKFHNSGFWRTPSLGEDR